MDSSYDESDIVPLIKRRKTGLDKIARDIKALKGNLANFFRVTRTMKVPLGLKKMTFRCTIWQSTPMEPPIIFF